MREDNPHTILSGDKTVGIFWNGEVDAFEPPKTRLFITDPPYNIGVKYGEGIFDRMVDQEYRGMIGRILESCFDAAEEDASMFLIHYPKAIAEMWESLTEKWKFRQWISWVYPTNTGHSKRKWTTAHRAIIWLTKGDPPFKNRAVTQNFKNPSVKVVKQKISEGVDGVALYDWWEIPQVKNISEEYRGYENQIPSELIRRIILSASSQVTGLQTLSPAHFRQPGLQCLWDVRHGGVTSTPKSLCFTQKKQTGRTEMRMESLPMWTLVDTIES